MPGTTKHLARARRHLEAAEKLRTDAQLTGWAAVILFYSARDVAHAVFDADPYLPDVCRHPRSHTNPDLQQPGTNVVIKRHYRAVELPYMDLYSTSKGVRYEGMSVSEARYSELGQDFKDICGWAKSQLTGHRQVPEWLDPDSA